MDVHDRPVGDLVLARAAGLVGGPAQRKVGSGQFKVAALALGRTATGGPDALLWIFVLTMAMLVLPKLLGLVATLADGPTRRGCGGSLRALGGVAIESVLTALIAPVTMYMHSRAVAEVLAGRDSGWNAQRRDDGSVSWGDLARSYGSISLFGLAMAALVYAVSPAMAAWMAPVLAGMVLFIPVAKLTPSNAVGGWPRVSRGTPGRVRS